MNPPSLSRCTTVFQVNKTNKLSSSRPLTQTKKLKRRRNLASHDPTSRYFWMNRYFNSFKASQQQIKALDQEIETTLNNFLPLKITLQQAEILYNLIILDSIPSELCMEQERIVFYDLDKKDSCDGMSTPSSLESFIQMISPMIRDVCGPIGFDASPNKKDWKDITSQDIENAITSFSLRLTDVDAVAVKEECESMLKLWEIVKRIKSVDEVLDPCKILVLRFNNEDGQHIEYGVNPEADETGEEDHSFASIFVTSFKLVQGIQLWFRTTEFGPEELKGNHLVEHTVDVPEEDRRDYYDASTQTNTLGGPNWKHFVSDDWDYDESISTQLFQFILFGSCIIG